MDAPARFVLNDKGHIVDTVGEYKGVIENMAPAYLQTALRAFNSADGLMRATGSMSSTHYEGQWGFYVDRYDFYAFDAEV